MEKSNSHLFYSHNIVSFLFEQFSLIIEYRKTKNFHFFRLQGVFDSLPLNLNWLRGPVLYPKDTWCYLWFILDKKLSFWQHINFYSNKVLSTIKYIKILSNSICGLLPQQKCLLYRTCILSIALYKFPL